MMTSYLEGFGAGRRWDSGHMPGGPYSHNVATQAANIEWKRGFADGLRDNVNKTAPHIRCLLNRASK